MGIKYYKELDGVRAIAALMVMFFHYFAAVDTNNSLLLFIKKFSIFGQTGVSLFFVLSGFLISRILLHTKEKPNYFYNFYIRRILRIFPLYYFFLCIFYFLVPVMLKTPRVPFEYQFYYWIYLQNFAMTFNWTSEGPLHFWSLAVEEHFYLFWPFVIYFLGTPKMIVSIVVLIVVSIFVRILLIEHNYPVFYFTFSRLDELALGSLLAILERNNVLKTEPAKRFLLLFLVTATITTIVWVVNLSSGNTTLQVAKFVLLALTFFSLLAYIIYGKPSNIIKKLLRIKPLVFSGKISYGLYVFHPLCFLLFETYCATSSFVINFIGSFLLSYIIATASYYFVERRFLLLKDVFTKNSNEEKWSG